VPQPPGPPSRNPRRGPGRSRTVQWVCDLLRNELLSGDWAEEPLPGEDALIRKYGVSRGIIRDVLAILADQGMVERVRGAGTFALAPSALQHEIEVSRDLAQEMNANGTRVAIRTTYAALHPAPSFIAERLELATGAQVLILESVTSLDGFPLSIRSAFMPADPFAVSLEQLAEANAITAGVIVDQLTTGTLASGLPPLSVSALVGIGQSMGGCILTVHQALSETFDAVAFLGWSGVHTAFPDPSGGTLPITVPRREDDLHHATMPTMVTPEQFRYCFHYDDVPTEVVDLDLDPSRLVDGPTGWEDRGYGDMHDRHDYPGPDMFPFQPGRAAVLGGKQHASSWSAATAGWCAPASTGTSAARSRPRT